MEKAWRNFYKLAGTQLSWTYCTLGVDYVDIFVECKVGWVRVMDVIFCCKWIRMKLKWPRPPNHGLNSTQIEIERLFGGESGDSESRTNSFRFLPNPQIQRTSILIPNTMSHSINYHFKLTFLATLSIWAWEEMEGVRLSLAPGTDRDWCVSMSCCGGDPWMTFPLTSGRLVKEGWRGWMILCSWSTLNS